jgi:uncharacterized MAPEG superfamily protein
MLLENHALRLFALTASILAVQLILLAFFVAGTRGGTKTVLNPEDVGLGKGNKHVEVDVDKVLRVKRAHQNLLENAVPFFVVGLLYALSGPSDTGAKAYFFTFLGARLLHSFFYLRGIQPFRTMSFAVGALAILGMAVHVIRYTLA